MLFERLTTLRELFLIDFEGEIVKNLLSNLITYCVGCVGSAYYLFLISYFFFLCYSSYKRFLLLLYEGSFSILLEKCLSAV